MTVVRKPEARPDAPISIGNPAATSLLCRSQMAIPSSPPEGDIERLQRAADRFDSAPTRRRGEPSRPRRGHPQRHPN